MEEKKQPNHPHKKTGEVSLALKHNLIHQVMQFCFSADFFQALDTLICQYSSQVDKEQEHKLNYTNLYKDFVTKFDKKLEDYLVSVGSSSQEFANICQSANYASDPETIAFIDILNGVFDYVTFIEMARDKNKKQYVFSIINMYKKQYNATHS